MKPTRLLLIWLGVLLGLNILLGAAQALQLPVPDSLHSVAWGLLLALLLLALLDAMRLRRRPSARVQRQMPGSLALGRWGEVRLTLEHDYPQPLTVQVFDHVPRRPEPGTHAAVDRTAPRRTQRTGLSAAPPAAWALQFQSLRAAPAQPLGVVVRTALY